MGYAPGTTFLPKSEHAMLHGRESMGDIGVEHSGSNVQIKTENGQIIGGTGGRDSSFQQQQRNSSMMHRASELGFGSNDHSEL